MDSVLFSIPLADLDYGDRDLDEVIPVDWLAKSFEGTEATPRGPGRLEVTVSKSGREVMVRGHAKAGVILPCARTLEPAAYDLTGEVFLLLGPRGASVEAGKSKGHAGKSQGHGHAKPPPKSAGAKGGNGATPPPAGAKKKASKPSSKGGSRQEREEEEARLLEQDAARDTYDGEKVVLDRFIQEFLLLELPMVPLREALRSEATPAIERPPETAPGGRPEREGIDPRLAPLAAIASRLRDKKE